MSLRPDQAPANASPQGLAIQHLPQAGRFEVLIDGHRCHLDYRLSGQVMCIHHTEVPPPLEGRGIAGALVQAAVDHVRAHDLRIQPLCSYVRTWLRRHPAHDALIDR